MRRIRDFRPLPSPFALSARTLRRVRLRRERSAWTSRSVRLLREQRKERLRRLRLVRVLRNQCSRRVRLACALSAWTRRRVRLVCALGNGTLRTLRLLQVRRNCDSASLRRVRGQSARRLRSILGWFVPNALRQLESRRELRGREQYGIARDRSTSLRPLCGLHFAHDDC
jgi:hypothetical protein